MTPATSHGPKPLHSVDWLPLPLLPSYPPSALTELQPPWPAWCHLPAQFPRAHAPIPLSLRGRGKSPACGLVLLEQVGLLARGSKMPGLGLLRGREWGGRCLMLACLLLHARPSSLSIFLFFFFFQTVQVIHWSMLAVNTKTTQCLLVFLDHEPLTSLLLPGMVTVIRSSQTFPLPPSSTHTHAHSHTHTYHCVAVKQRFLIRFNHLLEWLTGLKKTLYLLLWFIFKEKHEQPYTEVHRTRSGMVQSTGASVPMDLRCATCHFPTEPHCLRIFTTASVHSHDRLKQVAAGDWTQSPACLPSPEGCDPLTNSWFF